MVDFVANIDSQLVAERLIELLKSLSSALRATPGLAAIVNPSLDTLSASIENIVSAAPATIPGETISVAELTSQFGKALGFATKILGPVFSALVFVFFAVLLSIQMTLSAGEVRSWYADLIPPRSSQEFSWLTQNIRQVWTGFLRGQMLLMLVIGTVTWLGGMILGLPQALLLGIIAGVMELIPSIGPILAAIPAVLLALLFGSNTLALNNVVFALLVIGFYVIVQLTENQFLVPRIMGEAVDLPPLIVLIGAIAGAGAFGILGALLATPFIATGNLIFRYVYRKVMEDYFVPPPVEEKPGFLGSVKGFLTRFRRPAVRQK
jgi:predicted PurR-regulated permease PerM